jgi:hypothetical protein
MGGSLQTLPIQAMVMRLGFQPRAPPQLTSTTGTGESMFPGFQELFRTPALASAGGRFRCDSFGFRAISSELT